MSKPKYVSNLKKVIKSSTKKKLKFKEFPNLLEINSKHTVTKE